MTNQASNIDHGSGFQYSKVTNQTEEEISNKLNDFYSIKMNQMVTLSDVLELPDTTNKSYLILLTVNTEQNGVKIPQSEVSNTTQELVGLSFLKKDYGKVYIKPENFFDKLIDLFAHGDIDFENDPEFSKKYYVVASDEHKLRQTVSTAFLKTVGHFDGLEIEIMGKELLVRIYKPISPKIADTISQFLTEINNGEN